MPIRVGSSKFDSSNTSAIPSIFLSILISSIFFTRLALFTSKGISVTIIFVLPFSFANSIFDLTITFPRPVVKASIIPFLPSTIAPVGKSGPLTISKIVSNRQFGLSILLIVASITSPKLCVGIFVAYPALIPVAPFTNKFGNFAGKTTGSFSVSSKFQTLVRTLKSSRVYVH